MTELERLQGVVLGLEGDTVVIQSVGGIADRSIGLACALDTRFQLASVSKQFTAAAILVLADRGILSVRDSVGRWIDDCPPTWDAMTIHHLLTHTSGLGHWRDIPEIDLTANIEPEDELAIFRRSPLRAGPGAGWYYSSPAFVLLAHIVQRAADQEYASVLVDEVFEPLGMTSTFAGNAAGRERIARGYRDGVPVPSFELDVVGMGAGDVWSTVGDMARWDLALASGTFLSPGSRQAMLANHATVDDQSFAPAKGCGYGWFEGSVIGRRLLFHPGDNAGFKALNAWFVDDDVRLVVLTNDEATDIELIVGELLISKFSPG